MTQHFEFLKASVKAVVEKSSPADWTVQGFGMMRTYFDKEREWRLNVWHSSLQVKGVSTVHDHPWNFRSCVIAGKFMNTRFAEADATALAKGRVLLMDYMRIKTGEGGGPDGERKTLALERFVPEIYRPGDTYEQLWDEVHESQYVDGAVTLNRRQRVGTGEHARVFWPHGEEWVDAEPRKATEEEFTSILSQIKWG